MRLCVEYFLSREQLAEFIINIKMHVFNNFISTMRTKTLIRKLFFYMDEKLIIITHFQLKLIHIDLQLHLAKKEIYEFFFCLMFTQWKILLYTYYVYIYFTNKFSSLK